MIVGEKKKKRESVAKERKSVPHAKGEANIALHKGTLPSRRATKGNKA